MCGIFATKPAVKEWLETSLIKHAERGPDQSAIHIHKDIGVAVNRLAITGNLDQGSQPVFSKSGNSLCVFNGAIFNYKELANKFNVNPTSKNDGAILLELYEILGTKVFDFIQGMYAIVIVDREKDMLVVSRDPLGIKPLYWIADTDIKLISSSLKAIPKTLMKKAEPFPPGLVWTDRESKEAVSPQVEKNDNLDELLTNVIRSHIPNEVKWGCALSGGVDSSLVCALSKKFSQNFNCYVLDAGGEDDFKSAQLVAHYLDLPLKTVKVDKQTIKDAIPIVVEALASYNSQTILGGLGTYLISREAKRDGLKVLLSGEGADEVFGGYERYKKLKTNYDIEVMMTDDQNNLWLSHNGRVDHASMAASIEIRVPFQDLNVLGNAREIPTSAKVNTESKISDKICLREIASRYLPQSIAERTKTTIAKGSGLSKMVKEVLDDFGNPKIQKVDVFNYNIKNMLEAHLFQIWKEVYPELSANFRDLANRKLYTVSYN